MKATFDPTAMKALKTLLSALEAPINAPAPTPSEQWRRAAAERLHRLLRQFRNEYLQGP